jgi:pseudouridine-5'-monophosphatase
VNVSNAQAMPGAEELIRHLKAHNIPIAVGTSSSRQSFGQKTTLHRDWFALFDFIVTADDPEVGAAKPAPDIFLTAARRLGVAPEDCLVFEDSPFGVTAAKAAGMTAIAIPDAAMADEKYAHADGILRTLRRSPRVPAVCQRWSGLEPQAAPIKNAALCKEVRRFLLRIRNQAPKPPSMVRLAPVM